MRISAVVGAVQIPVGLGLLFFLAISSMFLASQAVVESASVVLPGGGDVDVPPVDSWRWR